MTTRRKPIGMSAVLLPFEENARIDWPSFRAHVERTAAAGLVPAVNMDTGYVNLLDETTRKQVLAETRAVMANRPFLAGAFVADRPGDPLHLDAYRHALAVIEEHGGTPIVFQSHGLVALHGAEIGAAYRALARDCSRYFAFELGSMFAPFGRIYDLDVFAELMAISACAGAKHSSLDRDLELQRLALRDKYRPDFLVLTGNDLAIDMIRYGSDYLLGLSTFAPDLFALRDTLWERHDPAFDDLNGLLQELGNFAFRPPVPAYKHSAAQFLHLRGWIKTPAVHPASPSRPAEDWQTLADLWERLRVWTGPR